MLLGFEGLGFSLRAFGVSCCGFFWCGLFSSAGAVEFFKVLGFWGFRA